MRVFIGVDPRQPVAFNVLQWSIARRASKPVSIVPLVRPQLPVTRCGLTEFTYTRYLCPALSGYHGISVFLDADMLLQDDILKLADFMDGEHDVYVRQDQEKFEWPSLMIFNNERCRTLTAEWINDEANQPNDLEWAQSVGTIDRSWNYCVGYDEADIGVPHLIHYTAGIPHFPETRQCQFSAEWWAEYESMIGNCSWLELMGDSVHAEGVLDQLQARKNQWRQRH